ncbi:UDP-glycosyltransferase 84B1-like [Gastrolobium bilobum]|uniref:UDP-glycosyltransferase 84B1-like n=1 Tax=Gastrolobium bilobum TaxID=150636 RepID=UPI002AB1E526|nr:UDP-glycosyltransferase 84B1-like [Gastrolobium bilobum]
MSPSEKEVHVLMVSAAFQGHLNPTFNFAKRLASMGVHVTLTLTEEARHNFNVSTKANENSHNGNIQLEFFSDGLNLNFDRNKDTATFLASIETTGAKNLSNLISHLSKDRNYSCMIITPYVPWAAEIAATHGIPCAMLWFQACALYSIYCRYVCKTNHFPNVENPNETLELPALPPLEVRELPSFLLPSCPPYYKKLVWDFHRVLDKIKWFLGSSVYEFEEEIVKSMASLFPILTIGPLVSPFLLGEKEGEGDGLSANLLKPEYSCLEWLDNKPPNSVIYVAFGSLTELSQKQIGNIATALKNTNRAFLLVIRKKDAEFPRGFLEETKGRGLVVTWCPQEKVLMHPAVACFVSHCGWNSTLEAVTAGVPVIAHPGWSDQPVNARLVQDVFKTGVKMRFGEDGIVSTEEVQKCIKEVMEGPKAEEFKKRAMELKVAARKALQNGGSSERNINQFLTEIARNST